MTQRVTTWSQRARGEGGLLSLVPKEILMGADVWQEGKVNPKYLGDNVTSMTTQMETAEQLASAIFTNALAQRNGIDYQNVDHINALADQLVGRFMRPTGEKEHGADVIGEDLHMRAQVKNQLIFDITGTVRTMLDMKLVTQERAKS